MSQISIDKLKYSLQDTLYEFPYHYLPWFDDSGTPRFHRHLAWGLDYLTYTSFVVDLVRQLTPQSLLDIGCGDGRLVQMLKPFVPHVAGVGLSQRAIAFARAFNPEIEFMCADIATLSGQYEGITLVEVLEHIPDEQMATFIQNAMRLLQGTGYMVITVPTTNIPINKKHYRHYSLDLLKNTIAPHLDIEKHWWVYRQGFWEQRLRSLLVNKYYAAGSIVTKDVSPFTVVGGVPARPIRKVYRRVEDMAENQESDA